MTKNMILVALVITIIGAAVWYYMTQSASNTPAPKAPDFAGLAPTETATGGA